MARPVEYAGRTWRSVAELARSCGYKDQSVYQAIRVGHKIGGHIPRYVGDEMKRQPIQKTVTVTRTRRVTKNFAPEVVQPVPVAVAPAQAPMPSIDAFISLMKAAPDRETYNWLRQRAIKMLVLEFLPEYQGEDKGGALQVVGEAA